MENVIFSVYTNKMNIMKNNSGNEITIVFMHEMPVIEGTDIKSKTEILGQYVMNADVARQLNKVLTEIFDKANDGNEI